MGINTINQKFFKKKKGTLKISWGIRCKMQELLHVK
jgi:hypothetical protein